MYLRVAIWGRRNYLETVTTFSTCTNTFMTDLNLIDVFLWREILSVIINDLLRRTLLCEFVLSIKVIHLDHLEIYFILYNCIRLFRDARDVERIPLKFHRLPEIYIAIMQIINRTAISFSFTIELFNWISFRDATNWLDNVRLELVTARKRFIARFYGHSS